MLTFGEQTRPRRGEAIVPMINVVFLLLIFFLMTARLTPPDPFAITPPRADGAGAAAEGRMLYLSAEGILAHGAARGDAAFAALAQTGPGPVLLRADAEAPAARLAGIVARLSAAGHGPVRLVTVPR